MLSAVRLRGCVVVLTGIPLALFILFPGLAVIVVGALLIVTARKCSGIRSTGGKSREVSHSQGFTSEVSMVVRAMLSWIEQRKEALSVLAWVVAILGIALAILGKLS